MKSVLLYSGGWDSYCASFIYPDAKKLYVNLHTPYSAAEMARLPADVEVQDLDLQRYVLADGIHVSQRNAILALVAAASVMPDAEKDGDTDIEVLLCGVYEDDTTSPDKSPEYFRLLSELASAFILEDGRHCDVTVKGFFKYDKIDLWEKAGKPDMRNVISCYTGNNCGRCIDCTRRLLYLNYLYPEEYKMPRAEQIKIIKEQQACGRILSDKIILNANIKKGLEDE